jgi:hypothetical protein
MILPSCSVQDIDYVVPGYLTAVAVAVFILLGAAVAYAFEISLGQ